MLKMARTSNSPNNRLFTEIVSPEWWLGCNSRVVSSSSVWGMGMYLSDIASEKVDLGVWVGVCGWRNLALVRFFTIGHFVWHVLLCFAEHCH